MVYTYWTIDVGERIQQLSDECASHIVCLLFTSCVAMWHSFLKVDAGMSGVNFAIAETGSVWVNDISLGLAAVLFQQTFIYFR